MSDLLTFSPPGALDTGTKSFAGAKAVFYDAGTTTPRIVYTDQAESVPAASPLVADAAGLWPEVFASGGAVKVVVTYSDDTTGYTLDPCPKVPAAGASASQISFTPTVGLPFTNVQAAIEGAAASAASGFTPFGLGVTGSVDLLANLDATGTATGQYRFDATTTGTYPTGVTAANTGAVMVVRETSGSAWMWLYHDTTDRVFIRRMTTSTWGAWRENITADIGATQGDILYRSATAWTRLAAGTAGQFLQTGGAGANPSWTAAPTPVKAWVDFNAVPLSGTYSRTGTLVTVTITGHGMSTGMVANLDFTTGTALDGSYTVTVTDANTFTLNTVASGTTSGNVTMNLYIRASFNVTSVTDNGTGDFTINFTSAISDANYAPSFAVSSDIDRPIPAIVSRTTTALRVFLENAANFPVDPAIFAVTVVR